MHIGGENRIVCPCKPPLPNNKPEIAAGLQDLRALRFGWLFRPTVLDQFDPKEQAFPANIANHVVFFF